MIVSTEVDPIIWGGNGWFTRAMNGALEDGPLPCSGQGRVYGAAADGSPIAAACAMRICTKGAKGNSCPILWECARAGAESGYPGVWGGLKGGEDPIRGPQPAAVRAWVASVEKKHRGDPRMIMNIMLEGIPTFGDLLREEAADGKISPGFTEDGCLALSTPDARVAVQIRRRITRDAVMLGIDNLGMARIELTCRNTASCISPWHMLWSSDREVVAHQVTLEGSRSVAFALFLLQDAGWTGENIQQMTGFSVQTISTLGEVALRFGDQQFVHGNAWDILQWGRYAAGPKPLNGQQENAVIRLVRAGEELSCSNVPELISVGRELY
jgi:hypothetical protein